MSLWIWFRRSSRAVRLFLVSSALFGVSIGIYDLLFNLYLLDIGFEPVTVGSITLIGMTATVLAAIPIGRLADRYTPRRFLVAGSLLYGVGLAALPSMSSFWHLAIVMVLMYLGIAAMLTTEFPVMAGEVKPEEQMRLLSLYQVCYVGGSGLGILIAGQLIHLLPRGPLSLYQLPLWTAGFVGVLMGILRLMLPLKRQPVPKEARPRPLRPAAPMLQVGLLTALAGGSIVLTLRLLNVVLRARYGLEAGEISIIMGLVTLFSLTGPMFTPWLTNWLGSTKAAVVIMVLTLGLQVAAGGSSVVLVFLPIVILRQALHYTQWPLLDTFALQSVPAEDRSTMASYRLIGLYLGMAAGAQVYGHLLSVGQFGTAFLLSGCLAITAAGCYYVFLGRNRKGVEISRVLRDGVQAKPTTAGD